MKEILVGKESILLLGEDDSYSNVYALLSHSGSVLVNTFGNHGAGKSHFLEFVNEELITSGVKVDFVKEFDGIDSLPKVDEDEDPIIILDDVDKNFSKEDFKEYILAIFTQNPRVKLIFSSSDMFFSDRVAGVNLVSVELGSRNFDYTDFSSFLARKNNTVCIPESITKNYYLFSNYCKNFNLIEVLFNQILNVIEKSNKNEILPKQFLSLLGEKKFQDELSKDLIIDYTPIEGSELFFSIREKDKSEKLRDIIIKYYPDEEILKSVMEHEFENSFVVQAFNSNMSYEEKVLNLCFSYDPPVLIKKVLGPRDIINELKDRGVGEATFAKSINDKVKLILRNIGLNILDEPKCVNYFIDQFNESLKLLESSKSGKGHKEFIVGLGISCYQDLEFVFSEFTSFYSKYFFGSPQSFADELNLLSNQNINLHRITFGKYIELFRVFNRLSNDERFQVKLMNVGKSKLVPEKILKILEDLSSNRVAFSHSAGGANSVSVLRRKLERVLSLSIDILTAFVDYETFPEIIKIKEINFDEFGRRLYVASGWSDSEIRFCMSIPVNSIDIYSYYYLLRKKHHISINPIIIPRTIVNNDELFASGEAYQNSSSTQKKQGSNLIDSVTVKPGARVLDVGCGNGLTTIDLFNKAEGIIVDAFDVSSSQIEVANNNIKDLNIENGCINFYVEDMEKFATTNTYDVVFSNATLHWTKNGKVMYKRLFDSLKPNGVLCVHQGGHDCYRGLHQLVRDAIVEADLAELYSDWVYPIFYPRKRDMEHILTSIGFEEPKVVSIESDGAEFPTLVEDFSNAGMLPYLKQLPDEKSRKALKKEYFNLAKKRTVDQYSNRLYIYGTKGEGK